MTSTRKLYQHIYQHIPWYGDSKAGRCPGVRLLPVYRRWLVPPVLDLGCGRGDTVIAIRALGLEAEGIDQVDLGNCMRVGSITEPIEDIQRFRTVLCIDCIEHVEDDDLHFLFDNMEHVRRQVFSINNGSAANTGQELHVNRKSFSEWDAIVNERFDVLELVHTSPEQRLYLTESCSAGKAGRKRLRIFEKLFVDTKIGCSLETHKTVTDCLASLDSIVVPSTVSPDDLAADVGCLFATIKHSIIRLRRRTHDDWPVFSATVERNIEDICRHFNTRWLISVADTYADYGSALESGNALCISVIGNWEKLALTERTMLNAAGTSQPPPERLQEMQRPLPLWDGMTSMILTSGANMLTNMFRRINASMRQTPVLQKILLTVIRRMENNPASTLSRINARHERDLFADIYQTFSPDILRAGEQVKG